MGRGAALLAPVAVSTSPRDRGREGGTAVAEPRSLDDPRPTSLDDRPGLTREGDHVLRLDAAAGDSGPALVPQPIQPIEPFGLSLGRTALCHEWFTAYGGAEETA